MAHACYGSKFTPTRNHRCDCRIGKDHTEAAHEADIKRQKIEENNVQLDIPDPIEGFQFDKNTTVHVDDWNVPVAYLPFEKGDAFDVYTNPQGDILLRKRGA